MVDSRSCRHTASVSLLIHRMATRCCCWLVMMLMMMVGGDRKLALVHTIPDVNCNPRAPSPVPSTHLQSSVDGPRMQFLIDHHVWTGRRWWWCWCMLAQDESFSRISWIAIHCGRRLRCTSSVGVGGGINVSGEHVRSSQ